LPAYARITLTGHAQYGGGNETTSDTEPLANAVNHLLTFHLAFAEALPDFVQNTFFKYDWKATISGQADAVDLGTSSTHAFITMNQPKGDGLNPAGGVSARRLDVLTFATKGARTPSDLVNTIVPQLTSTHFYELDRNFQANNFDPFQVLDKGDKNKADCATLCTLAKESLDLLGMSPDQSEVRYVFARTGTWIGLWATGPFYQTNPQHSNYILNFYAEGVNRFEACLYTITYNTSNGAENDQWWLGGVDGPSGETPKANAFDVLMREVMPNTSPPPATAIQDTRRRQVWATKDTKQMLDGMAVPLPDLPNVAGLTLSQAMNKIGENGYNRDKVTIMYIPTSNKSQQGLAISCTGTAAKGQPVSPYAPITLTVYGSPQP
jgi:hypothetical protein